MEAIRTMSASDKAHPGTKRMPWRSPMRIRSSSPEAALISPSPRRANRESASTVVIDPLPCDVAPSLGSLMRLEPSQARERFVRSGVVRLATANEEGQPHVVPCTFAVDDAGRIVIGIDNKPKTSVNLRRLANIAENPRVSLLA